MCQGPAGCRTFGHLVFAGTSNPVKSVPLPVPVMERKWMANVEKGSFRTAEQLKPAGDIR
jgi:hypothetical protein